MNAPPFDVRFEIAGWDLLWASLEVAPGHEAELAALRTATAERARERLALASLASDPTVAAMRALFRAAGCDPTRYRPASEALLRRLLKGDELPAIQPLVDLNNCLSAELAVPCCVAADGTMFPPIVLRAGREGEAYESLRGPFNLAAKPLLVDAEGPLDTPITGSQRVKVRADTRRAWLVAYLPHGVVAPEAARSALEALASTGGAVRIDSIHASVGSAAGD